MRRRTSSIKVPLTSRLGVLGFCALVANNVVSDRIVVQGVHVANIPQLCPEFTILEMSSGMPLEMIRPIRLCGQVSV